MELSQTPETLRSGRVVGRGRPVVRQGEVIVCNVCGLDLYRLTADVTMFETTVAASLFEPIDGGELRDNEPSPGLHCPRCHWAWFGIWTQRPFGVQKERV